jgi:hypothetical protein
LKEKDLAVKQYKNFFLKINYKNEQMKRKIKNKKPQYNKNKKTNKFAWVTIILVVIMTVGFLYYRVVIKTHLKKNVDISLIRSNLKDGDIIFHTSKSKQSKAIQLATKSEYSHIGLIFNKENGIYILEAVQPVKYTPIEEWIAKGEKKHFVVKRLKNADYVLTKDVIDKMKMIGASYLGKDYDIYFEWSDQRMYCSELVWKIYKQAANIEIGELAKLKDFDLSSDIVQKIIKERYGDKIPYDEKVISPASMFNSDKLFTIYEK